MNQMYNTYGQTKYLFKMSTFCVRFKVLTVGLVTTRLLRKGCVIGWVPLTFQKSELLPLVQYVSKECSAFFLLGLFILTQKHYDPLKHQEPLAIST